MAGRRAFHGLRRAPLTRLQKVISRINAMDAKETTLAHSQGRSPVLFVSDGNIQFALSALSDNAQACLDQRK